MGWWGCCSGILKVDNGGGKVYNIIKIIFIYIFKVNTPITLLFIFTIMYSILYLM